MPTITRPDLVAHGLPENSGFTFNFPRPLTIDDTISVLFPNGTHLEGSPCTGHQERLRRLLHGIDLIRHTGFELGPLDRPILSKSRGNIKYVDHASREDLIKKYLSTGSVETINSDLIVEVDIVWPGGSLEERIGSHEKFDFCLSSHVIEHVPDMIGWLKEIGSILKHGGLCNMAIPDKEKTFDHRRQLTGTAQLIGNHLRRLNRPCAEQIFDHVAYTDPIMSNAPIRERGALELAKKSELDSQYYDVHCQVFTQQSFLEIFSSLARMNLIDFRLNKFFETMPGANEFIVSLEKTDSSADEKAATFFIQL